MAEMKRIAIIFNGSLPMKDRVAAYDRSFVRELLPLLLDQQKFDAVYRLDKAAQEKALRSIQRIADIFSHIAEDRNALCGRLQTIASLTSLQNPVLS